MSVRPVTFAPAEPVRARRGRADGGRRRERGAVGGSRWAGYLFVGGYVVALVLLGIVPTMYALDLAFTTFTGRFTTGNFVSTFGLPQFLPAFEHIGEFLGIWLGVTTILVVTLALMLHNVVHRVSAVFRFIFYLPGALAGAASAILWLYMLDPTQSPFAFFLHWLGYQQFSQTVLPSHLVFVFAVMAFWTGAGGWIVIMYGALNNIPDELVEAAQIDGANAFQTALRIKLPLIRKWIYYMLVLSFGYGTQLFVEPQIVAEVQHEFLNVYWSPNELAYQLAFKLDNFNWGAAVSVDLLALGLIVAGLLVWRGKLFELD